MSEVKQDQQQQQQQEEEDDDEFGTNLRSQRRKRKRKQEEEKEDEDRPAELFQTPDFVKRLQVDSSHVIELLNRASSSSAVDEKNDVWVEERTQAYSEWLSSVHFFTLYNRAPYKQQYRPEVSLPASVAYILILLRRLALKKKPPTEWITVSSTEWNNLVVKLQDACIGFDLHTNVGGTDRAFQSASEHIEHWQNVLAKLQLHAVMHYETWRLMRHDTDNKQHSSSSSSHDNKQPSHDAGGGGGGGKELLLHDFLEQAARMEAVIGFVLHKYLERRKIEWMPVELTNAKSTWSQRLRRKIDDFMSFEPDGSMHASFRDLVLSQRLSCCISLQHRQLKPAGGHREQRVTIVDKMVTQQQLNDLLDLISGVELKTIYAQEDHPYHDLFLFHAFGTILEYAFRIKWFKHYLITNDIFSERYKVLDKVERYHSPRCPVIVCLLGEWYLALGTDRLIWCPSTWSAVMAWIWFIDEEHGGKIEDGLSLASFIDPILDE